MNSLEVIAEAGIVKIEYKGKLEWIRVTQGKKPLGYKLDFTEIKPKTINKEGGKND